MLELLEGFWEGFWEGYSTWSALECEEWEAEQLTQRQTEYVDTLAQKDVEELIAIDI